MSVLADYYAHLFPYQLVADIHCGDRCKRASWGYVARQFALFCRKYDGSIGVVNRNAHVLSADDILRLVTSNTKVARIEVGPWLTSFGCGDRASNLGGAMKQVVFDIDLDDFGGVAPRDVVDDKTDSNGLIGDRAWRHLSMATWLLDLIVEMRDRHQRPGGAPHRSFAVFSGRRGCHLWLPDDVVCKQTVKRYASAITGLLKRLETRPFAEQIARLLRENIGEAAGRFFAAASREIRAHNDRDATDADCIQFYRPMLDQQVVSSVEHLIKAPFSVHHATGLIAMPYDARAPPERIVDVTVSPRDARGSPCFDRAKSLLS